MIVVLRQFVVNYKKKIILKRASYFYFKANRKPMFALLLSQPLEENVTPHCARQMLYSRLPFLPGKELSIWIVQLSIHSFNHHLLTTDYYSFMHLPSSLFCTFFLLFARMHPKLPEKFRNGHLTHTNLENEHLKHACGWWQGKWEQPFKKVVCLYKLSTKILCHLVHQPHFLGNLSEENNSAEEKNYLYDDIYCSIISNNKKLERN